MIDKSWQSWPETWLPCGGHGMIMIWQAWSWNDGHGFSTQFAQSLKANIWSKTRQEFDLINQSKNHNFDVIRKDYVFNNLGIYS